MCDTDIFCTCASRQAGDGPLFELLSCVQQHLGYYSSRESTGITMNLCDIVVADEVARFSGLESPTSLELLSLRTPVPVTLGHGVHTPPSPVLTYSRS